MPTDPSRTEEENLSAIVPTCFEKYEITAVTASIETKNASEVK
jgi:hypothetical protein